MTKILWLSQHTPTPPPVDSKMRAANDCDKED